MSRMILRHSTRRLQRLTRHLTQCALLGLLSAWACASPSVALAPASPAAAQRDDARAAVRQWAQAQKLTLLHAEDCQCPEAVAFFRNGGPQQPANPGYEPYFVAGDFNRDGHLDVAAAARRPQGDVVFFIFNGPLRAATMEPAWASDPAAPQGFIWAPPRSEQEGPRLGAYGTDNGAFLQPHRGTYVPQQLAADES